MKNVMSLVLVLTACSGNPIPTDPAGCGGASPVGAGGWATESGGVGGEPLVLTGAGGAMDGGAAGEMALGGMPAGAPPAEGGAGGAPAEACVPMVADPCDAVEVTDDGVAITDPWVEGSAYCLGSTVVSRLPGEERCRTFVFTCEDEGLCRQHSPDSDANLEAIGERYATEAGFWRLQPNGAGQCTGQGIGSCRVCGAEGC